MKPHITYRTTSPHNDGPRMTGMQLYQHWVETAQKISTDPGIPEDLRLHACIFLEAKGLLRRRRPRRAPRLSVTVNGMPILVQRAAVAGKRP